MPTNHILKIGILIVTRSVIAQDDIDTKVYKDLASVLDDYAHVKQPKTSKEHLYFPYWDKGHWVFDRVKLRSTERPLANMLQKGKWTKHHECNQLCLGIYESFGEICAQRFVTRDSLWKYEYKRFHNMCYLEYENCKHVYKRN